MGDSPGLSIPLQVPLSKFEKQLARAEAAAVKRAKNIERKFTEANGRSGRSLTKSASASAQVFERAMQKETRAFQQLKASVDPAYAAQMRYEAAVEQVSAAVRMGAISQKEANAVLAQSRTAHLGAATAATNAAAQASGFYKISSQGRFVLQNTTANLSDIAVMLEMGMNPMRIMGQQVPQLAAGFGVLGGSLGVLAPLLGTVAAIGFPVAAFLLAAGDSAEESAKKVKGFADAFDKAEAAIGRANSAIERAASGDIDTLKEAYGEVNAEIDNLIKTLAKLELEKALVATGVAVDEFFKENSATDDMLSQIDERRQAVENLRNEMTRLQDPNSVNFGMMGGARDVSGEIAAIRSEIERLEAIDPIAEMFQIDPSVVESIRAARDAMEEAMAAGEAEGLLNAIVEYRNVLATIPNGPLADMGDELAYAEDLLRKSLAQTNRLEDAAGSVSFDGAAASASRMADEISRAVDAMYSLKSQGMADLATAQIRYEYRNDPIGEAGALAGAKFDHDTKALREAGFENAGEDAYYQQQRQARISEAREIARLNEARRPPKASEGKGGGAGSSKLKGSIFDSSEKDLQTLERRIEMIGKSRAEVVALTAKYDLLDAAKARGLNLDRRSIQTGQTLRDEIEQQSQKIADLTVKTEAYAEQAAFMSDLNQEIKDGLVDAIVEGENFGEVLKDVAKQLAKAALQAALFGDGPLSGMFGGGGGLLGGLFGGKGLPFFAQGTSFAPGGAAVVGEQGPEVVELPRGSRVIPNHRLGQSSGSAQVSISVHPSGEFDARVEQVSGGVAVTVAGGMISENNKQISQMQRR